MNRIAFNSRKLFGIYSATGIAQFVCLAVLTLSPAKKQGSQPPKTGISGWFPSGD
jgi:hypothetical protein